MDWPLCGLQGFIEWDVSVVMEDEGLGSSLSSVGGCSVDGMGSMMGLLDDV